MKNSKINHKKRRGGGGGEGLRKTFYGWEGMMTLRSGKTLDHSPILLDGGRLSDKTPFRFKNMWLKTKGFKEVGGWVIPLQALMVMSWQQS